MFDNLLKYGAGAAQLWSDMKGKDEDTSTGDVINHYIDSVFSGNYGDNINKGEKSDPEMIQEGIDAYQKVHQGE